VFSSTLMMEAARSTETFLNFHQTMWLHVANDRALRIVSNYKERRQKIRIM